MSCFLFTSEAVAIGHPDKLADLIADAILDRCLEQDPDSRVACEIVITRHLALVAGEITTTAVVNYESIVRSVIKEVGYDASTGFNIDDLSILIALQQQSQEIADAIDPLAGAYLEMGAGDQGMVFGFATNETKEMLPLSLISSYRLVEALRQKREAGSLAYLKPDGKVQVSVEYDDQGNVLRLHTVVISAQHQEFIERNTLIQDLEKLAKEILPNHLIDQNTLFYINPAGAFTQGGPAADTGLTGRKPIVDTYGGVGRHGGGAFSGKDPSKLDRSAAYMARYIAKNIVAAGLCRQCEIQISYAIGRALPIALFFNMDSSFKGSLKKLERIVMEIFDLTPQGIIETFDLKKPIYFQTAFPGHFGRDLFPWEKIDRVDMIQKAMQQ